MTDPEKSCRQQRDANYKLLKLIFTYGRASYGLLFDQFGDIDMSPTYAHTRFSKKLQYLVATDQLQRSGRGKEAIYTLGDMAFRTQPNTRAATPGNLPARVVPVAEYQGAKAAPGQYDRMHAPRYTPPPMQAMRAGSLDYQRYASHGDRC